MSNTFREKIIEEGLEEPLSQPVPEENESAKAEAAGDVIDHQDVRRQGASHPRYSVTHFLGGQWLRKQIPLILLCVLFFLLLVFNRYQVENLSKKKIALQESIDYLREQRIQMQKEYQESIKISRIAKELDSAGVGFISGPPYEIEINK